MPVPEIPQGLAFLKKAYQDYSFVVIDSSPEGGIRDINVADDGECGPGYALAGNLEMNLHNPDLIWPSIYSADFRGTDIDEQVIWEGQMDILLDGDEYGIGHGTYQLEDIPPEIYRLSLDTPWTLRRRVLVDVDHNTGTAVANFTGDNCLYAGDVNHDNVIDMADLPPLQMYIGEGLVIPPDPAAAVDFNRNLYVETTDWLMYADGMGKVGDPE